MPVADLLPKELTDTIVQSTKCITTFQKECCNKFEARVKCDLPLVISSGGMGDRELHFPTVALLKELADSKPTNLPTKKENLTITNNYNTTITGFSLLILGFALPDVCYKH